jgi:hypothetical protein
MRTAIRSSYGQSVSSIQILRLRIAIAILSGLICGIHFAHAAGQQLAVGDFLSRKYLQALEQTRSPFAAEEHRLINLVVVRKNERATEIMPVINFHEGGPIFRVDESGKGILQDSLGMNVGQYAVRMVNTNELTLGFGSFPLENFIAVNDVQKTIQGIAVAGKYLDKERRLYKLGAEGVAKTPVETFRFTVGIDHVPYHFDYIEKADTHRILKFVRKKCHLDIYEVTDAVQNQLGNDGTKVKPWAFLEEIGCKETN